MPATRLEQLHHLPRPVYGQAEALPNLALDYRHSHPWIQLSYASRGVLDIHTETGRYLAPPQRAVWIPAGVEHQVRCSPHTRIRSLYIETTALEQPLKHCAVITVSSLLRELIQAFSLLPEYYDDQAAAGRLVAVLLDELYAAPLLDSMLPLPTDPRLQAIARQLEHYPDDSTSLGQWAKQLNVSEKTLSRLFIKETGLGFRLWRQRLRLLAALPLLEQKQVVTEVALACGYDSVSAFIQAFSRHFNATPGEFFSHQSS